jgi:uncharacterized protein (DUF3084 family)
MKVTLNSILIGVLIVICAMLALDSYQKKDSLDKFIKDFDDYKGRVENVSNIAKVLNEQAIQLRKSADSKDTVIKKLQSERTILVSTSSKLTRERDSLKAIGKTIVDTVELLKNKDAIIKADSLIIVSKDKTIANQTSQLSIRDVQIAELKKSGDAFKFRGDSLQGVLDSLPKTPKNPNKLFNILPLPDRKQSFLLGVVATTVTWALTK